MAEPEVSDWNAKIIAEYRENAGKLSGPFEGAPIVLLHTTGAKSGKERVNPLMSMPYGDSLVVFGSKAGAPSNPDWYYNLLAHPDATVEVGAETRKVHARVADGAEHDKLWTQHTTNVPQFAEYEKTAHRTIPVIVLEPA